MLNASLGAELVPHCHRVSHGRSNIGWDIGLFITNRFIPSVLMQFSNKETVWIVVVFSEVECVNAPASAMHERIADRAGQSVAAPLDEDGMAGYRVHINAKLNGWRMVFVVSPDDIANDRWLYRPIAPQSRPGSLCVPVTVFLYLDRGEMLSPSQIARAAAMEVAARHWQEIRRLEASAAARCVRLRG